MHILASGNPKDISIKDVLTQAQSNDLDSEMAVASDGRLILDDDF